jgi:hypothetical protein
MLDNWVHSFCTAGATVLLGNAPADAVDAALQGSVGITHEHDNGSIAFFGKFPTKVSRKNAWTCLPEFFGPTAAETPLSNL